MKFCQVVLMVAYCLIAVSGVGRAAEWKAPGKNLAHGKSYLLDGNPKKNYGNYQLTAGNDDKDLTDGKFAETEMMWIDKACVAWSGGPRYMTFDLGSVQPIGGVGYRTQSRGASGIGWPPFILVMVSDDGKEFRLAGELVGLSSKFGAPPDEGRFRARVDEYNEKIVKNPLNRALSQAAEPPHWFRTDELKTHGRYVRLAVQSSIMVLTDEVEIYAGRPEYLKVKVDGPVIEKPIDYLQENRMGYAMSARLATDAARGIELVKKLKLQEKEQAPIIARLEKLRGQALKVELKPFDSNFRAILPLSPQHAEILSVLSAACRAAGYPEFTLWHNNRWLRQSPFDLPPALVDGKPVEVALDVHTLHNDRRGEVVNVGNFSGAARKAIVSFEGLPGGAKPEYIRVRQAEYLAMQSRPWDADPLPLAEETSSGWRVSLPAGVSRQLWFDFKPDTKSCPAGKHEGQVVVQIEGGPKLTFPLALTVGNYRLPEFKDRALAVGVWDYTDMDGWGGAIGLDGKTGVVRKNLAAAIKHEQESGVNVPWGRSDWQARGTFPRPSGSPKTPDPGFTAETSLRARAGKSYRTGEAGLFDKQGNLTVDLDFAVFDDWVRNWPDAKYYAIYANAEWGYAGAKGKDPASKGFTATDKAANEEVQRRLGVVMKKWAEHMPKVGVDPSQIVMIMVDEVGWSSQARVNNFWAEAIKKAVPEFKLIMDPVVKPASYQDPDILKMFNLTDIIIPGTDYSYHWRGQEGSDYYDGFRKKGKMLGFYSCAQNPSEGEAISYFRAQQWDCWNISKGGPESWAGFWNYSDVRGIMPWNPLAGGSRDRTWCLAYFDENTVTDGKHWLAIFEGANDYEYLQLLKHRIAELERNGEKSAEVAAAKKVLEEVPGKVFEAAHFQNQVDACDVGRLKVLAALQSLAPVK